MIDKLLFGVFPDKFFNCFTDSLKYEYAATLMCLYELINDTDISDNIHVVHLINTMKSYFQENKIRDVTQDIGNEHYYHLINNLKNEWGLLEGDKDIKTFSSIIIMPPLTSKFVNLVYKMKEKIYTPDQIGVMLADIYIYIKSIYSKDEILNSYESLEKSIDIADEMLLNLNHFKSSLRKSYDELNASDTKISVVENVFSETGLYTEIEKFNSLYTKSNVYTFCDEINRMAKDIIIQKHLKDEDAKESIIRGMRQKVIYKDVSIDELEEIINRNLRKLQNNIKAIKSNVDNVNNLYQEYYIASRSKIAILSSNNPKDIESAKKVLNLLNELNQFQIEEVTPYLSSLFTIPVTVELLDSNSIKTTKRIIKTKSIEETIIKNKKSVNQELLMKAFNSYISIDDVNRAMDSFLGQKTERSVREYAIEMDNDYMLLLAFMGMGDNHYLHYKATYLNKKIYYGKYELDEFIIERKEEKTYGTI